MWKTSGQSVVFRLKEQIIIGLNTTLINESGEITKCHQRHNWKRWKFELKKHTTWEIQVNVGG
jgi:hypothetical protein